MQGGGNLAKRPQVALDKFSVVPGDDLFAMDAGLGPQCPNAIEQVVWERQGVLV